MAPKTTVGGGAPKQYIHKKDKRPNNPHVGFATAKKESRIKKTKYTFDPYLDPQLQWTGKNEGTELDIELVPLHIHERIDPSTIIEKVLNASTQQTMMSFFDSQENKLPLYKAIDFYKHQNNWSNRLIAGDSLLVMNSLLEKEGMGEKVQMVYIDPPYGKKYASNFQPFVCKQKVKEIDSDLSQEPETILAFRDTWELEIHSYLSYLRDRMLLTKKLLTDDGSCFVQISIENMHLVRSIMDEIFGSKNFMSIIAYRTKGILKSKHLPKITDYIIWYAKDISQVKFNRIFIDKSDADYTHIEFPDGERRKMDSDELNDRSKISKKARVYQTVSLVPVGHNESSVFDVKVDGRIFSPGGNGSWKTTKKGMDRLIKKRRVVPQGESLRYVYYYDDYPVQELTNVWTDTQGAVNKKYVVQTAEKIIQRCMLMTTDPGDLILDPTCGSGTSAFIAEKFGRRWITCDTSRIATTIARQRLMTSTFDYYELINNHAEANEIHNGFEYEKVAHVTLEQLAQDEPGGIEVLVDKPKIDKSKHRISGPFTVEAVPAPTVKSIDVLYNKYIQETEAGIDHTAHESEIHMQQQWRDELSETGIRGKNKQRIEFSALNTHPTTQYIHAVGETKEKKYRVAISFGPEHAPLNQHQVEIALDEARSIKPKITMIVFAAMHFDPEASKNIDKVDWEGVRILKAEMNKDLLTSDLKKSRTSNESFWLVGQPDISVKKIDEKYIVKVNGYDYYDIEENEIRSSDTKRIVMWMLDTDYDGRSIYAQQLFFPMKNSAGSKGMMDLAKTLHAEINESLIRKCYGIESLPFEIGINKRIAVKIIDDRGIESLKISELE